MGLRPRLSAAAAPRLHSNPGLPPHRISLRLRARLLRLSLKGGVIGPWERGRPARILIPYGSLWGSLSFSTTLQAATTSAGTVTAGPKESQGDAAGRSRWRRWPSRAKPCAGGTPALPGSPHPTTSLFPLKRGVTINIGTKSQTPPRPSAHPSRASSNPLVALRRSSWPFVDNSFYSFADFFCGGRKSSPLSATTERSTRRRKRSMRSTHTLNRSPSRKTLPNCWPTRERGRVRSR